MKKIVIGLFAHVDAGKTTLSESLLYLTHTTRQRGRVDHGDTFLDYDNQERNRGITIFSKEARFSYNDVEFVLLDTPGHIDFSAEMERTLSVIDYGIVVISGLDGVQSHTKTIWNLLDHYHIPTFLFINKMDITQLESSDLLNQVKELLSEHCYDFNDLDHNDYENMALLDESLLNEYIQHQTLSKNTLQSLIAQRLIFPLYFGSALKDQGTQDLIEGLETYSIDKSYDESFKAFVYKISRDVQGQRLTHIKITGGHLKVRDEINGEKIHQIRLYNGSKYDLVQEVSAGDICTLVGLNNTQVGEGLGDETSLSSYQQIAYMSYQLILPDDCNHHEMMNNLEKIAEEIPELHLSFDSETQLIQVQVMGDIQIEILKELIKERFNVDVSFDQGHVLYKETITNKVEGVGHFEPLRHYAEVHVLLEPGVRGSGITFESQCSEDIIDRHYQRLIETHVYEKEHKGVLTGSPITDIKVTLVNARAHQKHTEGGDFREATYRALRHGLKKANSILLEPYYSFECHIPLTYLSKVLFDLEQHHSTIQNQEMNDNHVIIKGIGPVRTLNQYQQTLLSSTKGEGQLYCSLKGYEEVEDFKDIIESFDYDSEKDVDNPTGSIFCQHGAGFYVPYNEVENYMHLDNVDLSINQQTISQSQNQFKEDDLEKIFVNTYGPVKRRLVDDYYHKEEKQESNTVQQLPECLLVDGYNVIFSWPELNEIAKESLDSARTRLIDILGNYQGYKQNTLIIVFDAYKVKDQIGSEETIHNVHIVYTKEAQTADMYIERTTHELSKDYRVIVATSDALEQSIVLSQGARRMSSRELLMEVESYTNTKKEEFERKQEKSRNFLLEDIKDFNK